MLSIPETDVMMESWNALSPMDVTVSPKLRVPMVEPMNTPASMSDLPMLAVVIREFLKASVPMMSTVAGMETVPIVFL